MNPRVYQIFVDFPSVEGRAGGLMQPKPLARLWRQAREPLTTATHAARRRNRFPRADHAPRATRGQVVSVHGLFSSTKRGRSRRPDEDVRPVGSNLADAVVRVGVALDVRPVSGATEPSCESCSSGALPPSDVLARLGVGDAARGKPVPGRAAVSRRVAEVVPIEHVPAVRLRDGGDATVPDERRES